MLADRIYRCSFPEGVIVFCLDADVQTPAQGVRVQRRAVVLVRERLRRGLTS